MVVTWSGRFVPSSEADVARAVKAAENQFRVDFPPAFIAIATAYPMAQASPNGVALPDGSATALRHLLHFEAQHGSANIVNRYFPVAGVLDKGVIPFAEDIGGDLFCFNYREDYDLPPVAYWSVDTGTVNVARDFDAFVREFR